MKRFLAYVVFVTVVGIAAVLWFVATNEVDPASSGEDYGILQIVSAVVAMIGAAVACLVVEGTLRLARRRRGTVRSPT
jgi:energy-converting hydrogenase Eha subunit H